MSILLSENIAVKWRENRIRYSVGFLECHQSYCFCKCSMKLQGSKRNASSSCLCGYQMMPMSLLLWSGFHCECAICFTTHKGFWMSFFCCLNLIACLFPCKFEEQMMGLWDPFCYIPSVGTTKIFLANPIVLSSLQYTGTKVLKKYAQFIERFWRLFFHGYECFIVLQARRWLDPKLIEHL